MSNALWSLVLGLLSSIALPIGALIGMAFRPKPKWTGALAGFGAGALLAALAIELVAPTMMSEVENGVVEQVTLLAGCIAGGLIFVGLDRMLNEQGGYLRKTATAILYMAKRRRQHLGRLVGTLSRSAFFRSLPPDHIPPIIDRLHEVTFESGAQIFAEHDAGDRLFIIESGQVELTRDGASLARLGDGSVLGEIALITGAPRTASAKAVGVVKAFELLAHDFERLAHKYPQLSRAVREIAAERLESISESKSDANREEAAWAASAAKALHAGHSVPTPHDLRQAAESHGNPALAIWLGALMDGLPENFVLGTAFLASLTAAGNIANPLSAVPLTLLAGLFLSNFPEAMSSAVGMTSQGWSKSKILMLWGSLTVITAIMTMVGFVAGTDVPKLLEVGLEGLAAGAMLTMIAQTMIPEAVHLGGAEVVGLSTLGGFVTAVGFKLIES